MKRLFTILAVTVALGLIAFGYIWIENEKVAIEVSDFFPGRVIPARKFQAPTSGDVTSGAAAAVSGATAIVSGAVEAATSGAAAVATGK